MDNLFDIKLNINQIAEISGMHRQTVSQRLAGLTPTVGSNAKLKLYSLSDLIRLALVEKMSADVDSLGPQDRKAFWQAENERLKYERDTGELIPAYEVAQEMSAQAKAVVQSLETLPCGLSPGALVRVQQVIDDLRDQMAQQIQQSTSDQEKHDEDD